MPANKWLWAALLATTLVKAYEPAPTQGTTNAQAIVNGTLAANGAQPWMAALLRKTTTGTAASQRKFCGGALVAPTWIVTAAHCVKAIKADAMEILLGRDDLDGTGGTLHQVSRVIANPRYDAENNTADIALLQLATAATTQTLTLPTKADAGAFIGRTGTTLGWGSTSGQNKLPCTLQFISAVPANSVDYSCKTFVFRPLTQSKLLRSAPAQVLTNSLCNARFVAFLREHKITVPAGIRDDVEFYPKTLCVIDPINNLASACYGDSGGPLVMQRDDKTLLVGVTSFGLELSCQGSNHLEFYTEVADFLDFIQSTMTSVPALSFENLCAAAVGDIKVEVAPVVSGRANVKLSWQPALRSVAYRLLFVELPRRDDSVGIREAISATQIETALLSPSRHLVSVQAQGSACDGAVSKPVEVVVP